MDNDLDIINKAQTKDLGGHNPKNPGPSLLEEEDNNKIEIDIKKIYAVKIFVNII